MNLIPFLRSGTKVRFLVSNRLKNGFLKLCSEWVKACFSFKYDRVGYRMYKTRTIWKKLGTKPSRLGNKYLSWRFPSQTSAVVYGVWWKTLSHRCLQASSLCSRSSSFSQVSSAWFSVRCRNSSTTILMLPLIITCTIDLNPLSKLAPCSHSQFWKVSGGD